MSVPPIVATWQHRLDDAFPKGALCTWDRRGTDEAPYLVTRLEVTSTHGLDPVVRMPVASHSRVLGPWPVISYELDPRGPDLVRVIFEGIADAMLWSPHVSDTAAEEMAHDRALLIAAAPDGGETVGEVAW